MADLLTLDTIVENLNDGLNSLSTSLFSTSKIAREIVFNVVPHYQDNEESKDYDTARLSGVAVRLTGAFSPSQQYVRYNDRIAITFDAFVKDSDDIDFILNEYSRQNTGLLVSTNDWVYFGEFDRPNNLGRNIDSGSQKITIVWEILYNVVFKGITADDITLKINDVEVPVLSYSSRIEKDVNVSQTINDIGIKKGIATAGLVQKTIKFIHINNTEINKILSDIDSAGNLNRSYEIFYGVSCDVDDLNCLYSSTKTYMLVTGTVEYIEGNFQTIEATFLLANGIG